VATSPTSRTSAVFDASAVVRALVDGHPVALAWLARVERHELHLYWPTLLYVEVANALLVLQRGRVISHAGTLEALRSAFGIPATAVPLERLTEEALAVAGRRGLSAYDASYVVLAETLDSALVTDDRVVAAATDNAVLISG
jgi:predicted nucleic acid-binding protein